MLEKVTVTNMYGQKLEMELRHPEKCGYAVTGISGIQPTDVDIKTTQFVSGKKFKYNAGFNKIRTIGINIIFYQYNNDHRDIETLREELYTYFITNAFVTLTFLKSGKYYSIKGVVDKNQPTIFSQAAGATISIMCPELRFYLSDSNGDPIVNNSYTGSWNIWDGTGTDGLAMGNQGGTYSSQNNFVTDYIPVSPSTLYYLNTTNWENWICEYDSSKTWLRTQSTSDGVILTRNNCAYVRLTGKLAQKLTACFNLSQPDTSKYPHNGDYLPFNSIIYNGNMDTGFVCEIQNASLYNDSKLFLQSYVINAAGSEELTGTLSITPTDISSGASLLIDTMQDNLQIYTSNEGTITNRIDILEISSLEDRKQLPYISIGINVIKLIDEESNQILNTITYNTLYRGL